MGLAGVSWTPGSWRFGSLGNPPTQGCRAKAVTRKDGRRTGLWTSQEAPGPQDRGLSGRCCQAEASKAQSWGINLKPKRNALWMGKTQDPGVQFQRPGFRVLRIPFSEPRALAAQLYRGKNRLASWGSLEQKFVLKDLKRSPGKRTGENEALLPVPLACDLTCRRGSWEWRPTPERSGPCLVPLPAKGRRAQPRARPRLLLLVLSPRVGVTPGSQPRAEPLSTAPPRGLRSKPAASVPAVVAPPEPTPESSPQVLGLGPSTAWIWGSRVLEDHATSKRPKRPTAFAPLPPIKKMTPGKSPGRPRPLATDTPQNSKQAILLREILCLREEASAPRKPGPGVSSSELRERWARAGLQPCWERTRNPTPGPNFLGISWEQEQSEQ